MHVQSCCFAYKTYCFLTFSWLSTSLDLKVPIIRVNFPILSKNALNFCHQRKSSDRKRIARLSDWLPSFYCTKLWKLAFHHFLSVRNFLCICLTNERSCACIYMSVPLQLITCIMWSSNLSVMLPHKPWHFVLFWCLLPTKLL